MHPLADSKAEGTRSSHSAVPSGLRVDTWRLEPAPNRRDSNATFDLSFLRPPSEVSPGAQPASAALEASPVDWAQIKDNEPWWTDNTADDAPSLLSTARALEEQAQSLRLMATQQQQTNDAHNTLSRRQTVMFPLPSEGAFDDRYDMLQNGT